MRSPRIAFIVYSILLAALLWLLLPGHRLGDNRLPPLGAFFSPFHGFWQNAESPRDLQPAELSLRGLTSPVKVVMDDRLVPHIYAGTIMDAYRVQGYLHARYRLWQMDVATRDISGRLSEVLGERTLERDLDTRRMGFPRAAEQALERYMQDSTVARLLEAYADGVNQYIAALRPANYPLEFKLLDYAPEPWTPLKTVLMSKAMARTLTVTNYDVENENIRAVYGDSLFADLFPPSLDQPAPVHPDPLAFRQADPGAVPAASAIGFQGPGSGYTDPSDAPSFASNNWAIAPALSATGHPILCNDPHLSLSLPSIWYENHLSWNQGAVYGVSLLGIPGVIIGFNDQVAWGITNGGQDVADWLRITWADAGRDNYLLDGAPRSVELRVEHIGVRGAEDIVDTVRYTTWGPVARSSGEADLAFRWSGHYTDHSAEMKTFMLLNAAANYEEYLDAIEHFPSPIQNVVFASADGDIALKSQGLWPLRSDESGLFVADGSRSASSWNGWIPSAERPISYNPERGYVSSANQHSTGPGYPHIYFGSFEEFRGRVLNRYLEIGFRMDNKYMADLQNNNHLLLAEEALPLMLGLLDSAALDTEQRAILDTLRAWNYRCDPQLQAPSYFEHWLKSLERLSFEEFRADSTRPMRIPGKYRLIQLLAHDPEHIIFDNIHTAGVRETAAEVVSEAWSVAWDSLATCREAGGCPWHQLLNVRVPHLARIPAFSVENIYMGGHKHALNATRGDYGPSWRMIVELTPKGPRAQGVYPGGQSGNPGSRYYATGIDAWSKGRYYDLDMAATAEEVKSPMFTLKIYPK